MELRIIVCGGQYYANKSRVFEELDMLNAFFDLTIINGACPTGADHFANQWARERGQNYAQFFAEWTKRGTYAGFYRNQKMADEGRADMCLAFAGGKGTADMIERAHRASIPVVEIRG